MRIDDQVVAAHDTGQESPCQLVLALCTRFESGQALAQAIVDALVVAGFEMESRNLFVRAPVAAVKRVATTQA